MAKKRKSSLSGLLNPDNIEQRIAEEEKKNNHRLHQQSLQNVQHKLPIGDIGINPELEAYIRPQTDEEFAQFSDNVLRDGGIREPITVTTFNANAEGKEYTLVDGHHRLKVSKELSISDTRFATIPVNIVDFGSVADIKVWMLKTQLGRRNLTPAERNDIVFRMEDLGVFEQRAKINQGVRNDLKKGIPPESDKPNAKSLRVNEQLAELAGSSKSSIVRQKKIRSMDADLYSRVVQNEISITEAYNQVKGKQKEMKQSKISLELPLYLKDKIEEAAEAKHRTVAEEIASALNQLYGNDKTK